MADCVVIHDGKSYPKSEVESHLDNLIDDSKAKAIIAKTEFDGVHQEMKKNPDEFLKYISEQANGSEEARTELESGKGMTKSLIDLATKIFPKESFLSPKIESNAKSKTESSEERQSASISKESAGEEKTLQKGDVKNKEGAEEIPSPSKQKQINETLEKIKKYNESSQGESKRALLNEIRLSLPEGHTIKYNKGFIDGLYNEKGNPVQTRSEETNRTEKEFDKSGYHQDVQDIVKGAAADDVYANGLVVKGADGRNMSDKQIRSALKDIREGKDTVGSKAIYDAIAGMHERGIIDIKVPVGGEIGVPFKEYMDAFKEPLKAITDEEINSQIAEISDNDFNKLFDDTLNDVTNEQVNEPSAAETKQPISGQTDTGQKETGRSPETTEVNNQSQPQQAAAAIRESAERLAADGDRDGAMKLFQQADRIESGKPPPPEGEEPVSGRPKEEKPTVSITNAAVTTARLNAGLRPVLKEAVRKFGQVWDDARNRVLSGTTDPRSYVADLFSDIKNVPSRTFGEIDNAIVLMDRIDLTNQKRNALTDLDKARKTGNDNVEALAWQQLSEIEQKIQQNDLVADKIGTAQGRALSSRRLLAYDDYSLASMERDIAKYYPDKEVPKEIQARLEKIEAEHAEALKKLGEYEQKWKDQQAEAEFKKQNEKVKYKSKLNKEQSKVVAEKLRVFADKLEKFGRADLPEGTQRQGLDIQKNIADAIRYIADKIETGDIPELIAAAINKFGGTGVDQKELRDKIKEGLMDAGLDEKLVDEKTQKEKLVSKITELAKNSNASTITKDMVTPLRKLVNDYSRNGETEFKKALDQVHSELKDHFTNLTKEDVRDAYSGYGDVRLDSKTELSKKVAEWKKEATLLGQIGDVLKGEIPHRGEGGKKTKVSEKIESMRKDLENKMKAAGIEWKNAPSTPQEKNARALTSLKTRIQKEIENITSAIENKKELPERQRLELDDEAKALTTHRDALKEALNHILGKEAKKTLTDEQRISRAEKYLNTQSEKLSKDIEDIKTGEYKEGAPSKTPQSTTIDLMRGRRDALNELKRKLLIDSSPQSSEPSIALEKYKDLLRNKLLDYSRRIEDGDFEDKESKKVFSNDAEAHKLELQQKRAETAFKQEKVQAEKKNRTKLQKVYDRINQWKRFSVLTGVPTIGKLGSAVAYRTVFNPIEELTGTLLKYTVPGVYQLSKLAPREGGSISFKAESSALSQWARAETYKDAVDVIKRGQSELDERFGKYVSMPPEALEVMGRIHGAMKNFAKRQEFARSYEKRIQHAIDNGGDPADELTQLTAQSQAYIDANRSIFMQDNWLVNKFNELVGDAEKSGKFGPETTAAITRFLLPIVKIPTNFVAESVNYSFGSLRVAELFTRSLTGHLNDMTPEQADSLMRSIKKGTMGAAAMAIGFAMPGIAGGYYVKNGKKPEPGGLEWGELEIAGVRIPRWATHFPLFEAMQLGATMRQVMGKDIDAGKTNEAALTDGIIKSGRGMIDEVPLFNFPEEISEGIEQGDVMNKLVYPEIRSNIPIALQYTAAQMDKDKNAQPVNYFGIQTLPVVKRTPEGFTEQMEYGIPGLRQNVPTTAEVKERKKQLSDRKRWDAADRKKAEDEANPEATEAERKRKSDLREQQKEKREEYESSK